jgi:cell division protein FtsQ
VLKWLKQDIEQADDQGSDTQGIDSHMSKPAAVKIAVVANKTQESKNTSDWYVRPAMILTIFALFCGLLYNAGLQLWAILDQPISVLKISGDTQFVDKNQLNTKLVSDIGGLPKSVSLLRADIKEIQQLTVEDPWVNNAVIKRQWPNSLEITVQEQVPVAKWGSKGLLNHQGDIFLAQHRASLSYLPLLNGPSTDTARVMDQYHTLSQFFKGADSFMLGLSLQARGAWTILLDNQIEVELGRENVLPRLRRFLQLYKGHLYLKANDIKTVDVRYTNGLAVKWRPEYLKSLQVIQSNK